jgi:ATP-dependent Clp protease adaptor protein ClpS|tara:strand:- start:841 stop:1143 length:303 start_codon:yes stop_codon:yes gene_type:complete
MSTQDKIIEKSKLDLAQPKKYKVILHNDDVTPMEFVIELLINVFNHTSERAEAITTSIHLEGAGIAGVYYFEIAEQKMQEGVIASRSMSFPLVFEIEEEL